MADSPRQYPEYPEDSDYQADTPSLPSCFNRFIHAIDSTDDAVEFFEASGTYTGRNLAPPRRQGRPYQRPTHPVEGN